MSRLWTVYIIPDGEAVAPAGFCGYEALREIDGWKSLMNMYHDRCKEVFGEENVFADESASRDVLRDLKTLYIGRDGVGRYTGEIVLGRIPSMEKISAETLLEEKKEE